jgi:hypothetical protein
MVLNLYSYLTLRIKIFLMRYLEKMFFHNQKRIIKKAIVSEKEILIVLSIGKVGSSSLYASLKKIKPFALILHLHTLTEAGIQKQRNYYLNSHRKSVPFHLIQSQAFLECMPLIQHKIKLITLIREPISRELSSIFQDTFNFSRSKKLDNHLFRNIINDKVKLLMQRLPEETWFEEEIYNNFQINVFDRVFNSEKGFVSYVGDKVELLLFRLDDLERVFEDGISSFLSIDSSMTLVHKNDSEGKFYVSTYKTLSQEVKLSKEEMIEILNSKFIRHFYSDKKDLIIRQWQVKR